MICLVCIEHVHIVPLSLRHALSVALIVIASLPIFSAARLSTHPYSPPPQGPLHELALLFLLLDFTLQFASIKPIRFDLILFDVILLFRQQQNAITSEVG